MVATGDHRIECDTTARFTAPPPGRERLQLAKSSSRPFPGDQSSWIFWSCVSSCSTAAFNSATRLRSLSTTAAGAFCTKFSLASFDSPRSTSTRRLAMSRVKRATSASLSMMPAMGMRIFRSPTSAVADSGASSASASPGQGFRPRQESDVRVVSNQPLAVRRVPTAEQDRQRFARRNVHFRADPSNTHDELLCPLHLQGGVGIEQFDDRFRVGLMHDGGAVLPRQRRRALPDFLGDEWHERVGESQYGFQHLDQRTPGAPLFRFGTTAIREHWLRQFQVPVAVLVPGEFVDGLGGLVEAVALD